MCHWDSSSFSGSLRLARASQKHFTGLAEELAEDRLAVIILEEATQTHGTQNTSYT